MMDSLARRAAYLARHALIGCLMLQGVCHAAPAEVDTGHVKAQLVASAGEVRPGERITIGLHQQIIEHWHTYWVNPGDSGLATTIAWQLPPGASAGAIEWPVPRRIDVGPVTNYGYDRDVTLLTAIEVPKDAQPGASFPVNAKVNWLVCREVCIPQKVELSLSLPVVAAGAKISSGSPLIEQARLQLPQAPAWSARAEQHGGDVLLRLPKEALAGLKISGAEFFPLSWGQLTHSAVQVFKPEDDGAVLRLRAGESPAKAGDALGGVLVLTSTSADGRQVRQGLAIQPTLAAPVGGVPMAGAPAAVSSTAPDDVEAIALGSALLLAFLGGLVLNLMPCVFPVLSIKALSLLQHREQSPAQARGHGLAYTLGVLASFAGLAGVLIALKAGGAQVGWGFQFQSPLFVLLMAYLMFAVGLSLSGLFSVGQSVTGVGSSWASRDGYAGSFATGVLATVVATPCTAPFMGGAIGFALAQPPVVLLAVFLSLGFGLALPFLALSLWPALHRWLPRPGLWMERLKQAFAFPMYGAAVWLVWVLAQQLGPDAVALSLAGMVGIGFAAWLYGGAHTGSVLSRRLSGAFAALVLIGALGGGYAGIASRSQAASVASTGASPSGESKAWQAYTPARLQDLRATGQPVFVNLTAAWCITCLVNERVALSQPPVAESFKSSGITYLKGDWTNQDPEISKLLAEFGRSGVPLYVLYPKGSHAKPVVLPQILTTDIVLAAVKDAATLAVSSSR